LERLAQQKNQTLGGQALPMGFGDFFFAANDPLHPDLTPDDIDPEMMLPGHGEEDDDDYPHEDEDDSEQDDGDFF